MPLWLSLNGYGGRMLASLLPGFRDVRTPLTVGYLWLLSAWLIFSEKLPTEPPSDETFVGSIYKLHQLLGNGATVAAISFCAFLIGSVVSFSTDSALSQKFAKITQRDATSDISRDLAGFLNTEFSKIGSDSFYPGKHDMLVPNTEDMRARLLVANQEMYGEYDRLDAEGAFRMNISVPLLALAAAFLIRPVDSLTASITLSIGTLALAIILIYQGTQKHRLSSTVLVRAVLAGIFEHPAIAFERSQRSAQEENERRKKNAVTRSDERREALQEALANLHAGHKLKRDSDIALATRGASMSTEDRIRHENDSEGYSIGIHKREQQLLRIFDED